MKIKTNMNSVKSFRLEINVYVYEMDKDRNVCMFEMCACLMYLCCFLCYVCYLVGRGRLSAKGKQLKQLARLVTKPLLKG